MTGHVLVAGASRGIGAAITRDLVSAGYEITGVYRRNSQAANALRAELGDRLHTVAADLVTEAGIDAACAAVAGQRLAGVVLSAGISVQMMLDASGDAGESAIREQIRGDLEAPLLLCRALLLADSFAENASLVFVSSNLARHGLAGKVAYSAAKGGLEAATRALAHELGPRGIRVNAVAPGLIRTDMTAARSGAQWIAYAHEVPLGRAGQPADVAPLVTFLMGGQSSYITGQVIDVDGGWGA